MTGLRAIAWCGVVVALWPPYASRAPVAVVERVVVVDSSGSAITGLPASAFEVRVDGTVRAIQAFSADPVAFAAVVLIDVTASMPVGTGSLTKPVASQIVGGLRPGDRLRVGAVAAAPVLNPAAFSSDPRELRKALDQVGDLDDDQRYGPSPVWDAVTLAAGVLSQQEGRRAILLITDGRSAGNRFLFDDMVRQAIIANVAVSVIGEGAATVISQTRTSAAVVKPELALQRLAHDTGGVYFADTRAQPRGAPEADTVDLVRRILREWRHTYTLTFEVESDSQFHRLEVRVDRPGAVVRSRAAFLAK